MPLFETSGDVRRRRLLAEAAAKATAVRRARSAATRRELLPKSHSLDPLGRHIACLTAIYDVEARRTSPTSRARAQMRRRRIFAPAVTGEEGYAIALHELAHVVGFGASPYDHRHLLSGNSIIAPSAECRAWAWAIAHALRWSVSMQTEFRRCLTSYWGYATPSERLEILRTLKHGEAVSRGRRSHL